MSSKTEIQDSRFEDLPGSKARGIDVAELKAQCLHCDMNPVCHPASLNVEELDSLDQWFPTRRRLQRFAQSAGEILSVWLIVKVVNSPDCPRRGAVASVFRRWSLLNSRDGSILCLDGRLISKTFKIFKHIWGCRFFEILGDRPY